MGVNVMVGRAVGALVLLAGAGYVVTIIEDEPNGRRPWRRPDQPRSVQLVVTISPGRPVNIAWRIGAHSDVDENENPVLSWTKGGFARPGQVATVQVPGSRVPEGTRTRCFVKVDREVVKEGDSRDGSPCYATAVVR